LPRRLHHRADRPQSSRRPRSARPRARGPRVRLSPAALRGRVPVGLDPPHAGRRLQRRPPSRAGEHHRRPAPRRARRARSARPPGARRTRMTLAAAVIGLAVAVGLPHVVPLERLAPRAAATIWLAALLLRALCALAAAVAVEVVVPTLGFMAPLDRTCIGTPV